MAQEEKKADDFIEMPKQPDNPIICDNYINGEFVAPLAQYYMEVKSPHNGKVIGKVGMSSKEDVEKAVKASHDAYLKWKKWTVKERIKPLLKLRMILQEKEDELAELIMLEHGKNRSEALGSIRKGNETVQYACSAPILLAGKILEVSNGVRCTEFRESHGVVASIVPF
eukprot:395834_1